MSHSLPISAAAASVTDEPSAGSDAPSSPGRLSSLRALLFEHAFVPLALSAFLCFAFWFTRVILTGTATYDFLIKNLFLAWLPYFFSLAAVWMKRSPRPRSKWSIAAVWAAWLVTFPNAPYIFTDLIHWRDRPRVMPWWFDLGLVLMFGLAGCFAGIVSLRMMHDVIRGAIGSIGGWAFVTAVALLSGFGIYLGRFERWNSWDLFIQPHRVITQTFYRSLGPQLVDRTFGVTLMFGAMILVTYVMFVSLNPPTPAPAPAPAPTPPVSR